MKRHNRQKGYYFFSSDTLQFFNSKIESGLVGDRYFITSERMELSRPKLFTVRRYNWDTGRVSTVGRFQEHKTLKGALARVAEEVSYV